MIQKIVAFSLSNRMIVLAIAVLLFIWGVISFRALPVEAYPDVANNYVNVITQWPGRAAEEIEQQVTIPIEIVMNGIPHLTTLRSASLVGVVERDHDIRRRFGKRLEPAEGSGAAIAAQLPNNLQPQMGTDWSPVGQIYFYTLRAPIPNTT